MTTLQDSLATAYAAKFSTNEIGFGQSEQFKVGIQDLTDEQIVVIFRYGKRKFNDMWNSSDEKKQGKTVQSYWAGWLERMVQGRVGGGGSLSAEQKGWIAFFAAEGHKEGGKPVNGKTLRRAQESIVRAELLAEHDVGTPERKDVEGNLQKHLEQRFEEITSLIENDADDPIGALIALERAKEQISTKRRGSRLRGK